MGGIENPTEREMRILKKIFLLICAAAIVLSGCVKSDTAVVFNGDKTIDMTVVYSIERNAGATDEAIESIIESAAGQLDGAEIGYETGKDDNAYTITVPLRFDNVEEMTGSEYFNTLALIPRFTSGNEAGWLHISLDDDGDLEIDGVMNSETLGFDSFINQAGIEPDKLEAHLAVELPDGTSEEWSVKGNEDADISFTADNIYGEASGDYSSYAVIAAAAVLVIAMAIIILPKKQKKEDNERI